MSADHEIALRHNLATVRRGYEPAAVVAAISRLEAETSLLQADRNQAIEHRHHIAGELKAAHAKIEELRGEVRRLGKAPVTSEDMSQRLRSMLSLAEQEAAEIRAKADEDASLLRSEAEDYAWQARHDADERVRHSRMQAEQLAAERTRILDAAHQESAHTIAATEHDINARTIAAEQERKRADDEASQRRAAEDEDYRIASDARRMATNKEIESERIAATAAAEAVRRAAKADAAQWRDEATKDSATWRDEATAQAAQWRDEATAAAKNIRSSARRDADALTSAAHARVAELAAVRDSLVDDIAHTRAQLESFSLTRSRYDGDLAELAKPVPSPWEKERASVSGESSPPPAVSGGQTNPQTPAPGYPPKRPDTASRGNGDSLR